MVLLLLPSALAGPIPAASAQLILGWTDNHDASQATLQRYTRQDGAWVSEGAPVAARVGREGLAWGIGLHPPQPGQQKVEGDWRAPAGVFAVGEALGDALLIPAPSWPMSTVTERTLWVEDPASSLYNQRVVIPPGRALTDWETAQRMRLGDNAHRLKVVIEHNTDPPLAGAGSAIFFHIWRRDGASPTAGCTAMPAADLEALIRWLDPDAAPVFVLLARPDHDRLAEAWALPSLPTAGIP